MSHSFVLARLVPKRSAYWTSCYGIRAAAFLPTRPFVALSISSTELQLPPNPPINLLFLVSSKKPIGFDKDFYLALTRAAESEKRILTIDPPLLSSDGRPLYLHTCPGFLAWKFVPDGAEAAGVGILPYQLDTLNFSIFHDTVLDDRKKRDRLLRLLDSKSRRVSGGEDDVGDNWDTFSGSAPLEELHNPNSCVYELVGRQDLQHALISPTLHREMLLYHQLTSDYSWEGVTFSVDWLKMIRKEENVLDIPLVDASGPASENTPHLGGDLLATANALRAMRIPLDGEAPPAKDSTEEYVFDWDYEPSPQFRLAPKHRLGVPRGDIEFIVFDLFGTVLDRDRAIRDALSPLKSQFTATELFELYIESEALRRICSPDAPISELIRSALEDVARHADVAVDEEVLNSTMQQVIRPQLYPDAMPAVNALYMHGYRLIYMSSGDANSIHQIQSPLASKLEIFWTMSIASHSPMPDSYASLFEHCAATVPGIKPDQIMVVTSSRYRVVEPASDAGMPSALVQRAENLESKVDFRDNGVPATVTVDGLGSLCEWLGVPLVNG